MLSASCRPSDHADERPSEAFINQLLRLSCVLICRFKAKMWLCESHPLSLAEQVVPIIDLMAISNALFAKLRDFITLRLPPGFPVKIGERGRERNGDEPRGKVVTRYIPPFLCRNPPVPHPERQDHLQQPERL